MSDETEPLCETIDLLTTDDLIQGFARTKATIETWRKTKGLPFVRITGAGQDAIRFRKEQIEQWAQENGKEFTPPERFR